MEKLTKDMHVTHQDRSRVVKNGVRIGARWKRNIFEMMLVILLPENESKVRRDKPSNFKLENNITRI